MLLYDIHEYTHNNPAKDIERKLHVNPEWLLMGEFNNHLFLLLKPVVKSCPCYDKARQQNR